MRSFAAANVLCRDDSAFLDFELSVLILRIDSFVGCLESVQTRGAEASSADLGLAGLCAGLRRELDDVASIGVTTERDEFDLAVRRLGSRMAREIGRLLTAIEGHLCRFGVEKRAAACPE